MDGGIHNIPITFFQKCGDNDNTAATTTTPATTTTTNNN